MEKEKYREVLGVVEVLGPVDDDGGEVDGGVEVDNRGGAEDLNSKDATLG